MTEPLPNTRPTEEAMDPARPQKPLIDVVRERTGEGFIFGGVMGSIGYYATGGVQAVRAKVPRLSGQFAVFLGIYSGIEHAMVNARRKEEPVLNSVVAASAAYAIPNLPRGFRAAGLVGLVGGALGGVVMGGIKVLENWVDKENTEKNA